MISKILISILIVITASGPNWCCCTAAAVASQWSSIQNWVAQFRNFDAAASKLNANEIKDNSSRPVCPRCLARNQIANRSPASNLALGQDALMATSPLQITSTDDEPLSSDFGNCHCQQRSPFRSTLGHSGSEQLNFEHLDSLNHHSFQSQSIQATRALCQINPFFLCPNGEPAKLWGRQILSAYQILRC